MSRTNLAALTDASGLDGHQVDQLVNGHQVERAPGGRAAERLGPAVGGPDAGT